MSTAPASSPKRPSFRVFLFLAVGLFFVGLILSAGFFIDLSKSLFWQKGPCYTTGKTIDVRSRPGGRDSYVPVITLIQQAENRQSFVTRWEGEGNAEEKDAQRILSEYRINEVYSCWYNPWNPREVEFSLSIPFFNLFPACIGLPLAGVMFWLLTTMYLNRRKQNEPGSGAESGDNSESEAGSSGDSSGDGE